LHRQILEKREKYIMTARAYGIMWRGGLKLSCKNPWQVLKVGSLSRFLAWDLNGGKEKKENPWQSLTSANSQTLEWL
jgi:hypothetical protein